MSDHCDWCGRAIKATGSRWEAVKGAERGYDPLACDANPDGAHTPADRMTEPSGHVPVEQLRALIALLWPDEITPTARRMLLSVCDQHEKSHHA